MHKANISLTLALETDHVDDLLQDGYSMNDIQRRVVDHLTRAIGNPRISDFAIIADIDDIECEIVDE